MRRPACFEIQSPAKGYTASSAHLVRDGQMLTNIVICRCSHGRIPWDQVAPGDDLCNDNVVFLERITHGVDARKIAHREVKGAEGSAISTGYVSPGQFLRISIGLKERSAKPYAALLFLLVR